MSERDEILATLRDEFRANTRARLDEMDSLAEQVLIGNAESCVALRRHFHGLAGLGGTYGYTNVSEIGRTGERLCQALEDNVDGFDRGMIRDLVASLRHAIELDPPA